MIGLDRKTFYRRIRRDRFRGRMTQAQVDGVNDVLDSWDEYGTDDPRHLAYVLATIYHETGGRMQPVREGFASSDRAARRHVQTHYGHKGRDWYCWPAGPHGHVYYGRGDVQLTWYENYEKMGARLGLPLAKKPDLALKSSVSKKIAIVGMLEGRFTGHTLEDYFSDFEDDAEGARRIVNLMDRAALIAGYHDDFLRAIRAGQAAYEEPALAFEDDEGGGDAPARLPPATDGVAWGAVASAGGTALAESGGSDLITYIGWGLVALGLVLIVTGRLRLVRDTGE